MSHQPLVSAIVIFLNAGTTFFKEAIASIFAQTYENWELLLVDDGSTDESSEIAKFYAQTYPEKVCYLEHSGHKNCGMSASRNLGIRHAKGEYIALLDADDIWLPQKLEKQVAILETHSEAAMVYSSTWMWFSWTENPGDAKLDHGRTLGVEPDTLVKAPHMLTLFLQNKAHTPGTCSVLMQRELVKAVGGFEESFRGMYEDQAFFSKVCLQAPVFIQSGYWDRYRQHAKGSCYVAQSQGQYDPVQPNAAQLRFLNWLESYLAQQGVKDGEVIQALQQALFPYRHPFWYSCSQTTRLGVRKAKRLLKSVAQRMIPTLHSQRISGQVIEDRSAVGKSLYRVTISPVTDTIQRPLWSVMIPTYNCANYLRETLASVLAQDPGADIMHIEVVDDGSTQDNPAAVVEELGKGRVNFYQQPQNVGYIRNFETCLQRSRGHLIHLLHGDDCVKDGFYRQMESAFKKNPDLGAAFCRHIAVDERGDRIWISDLEQSETGIFSPGIERLAEKQCIQTPSIVVPRHIYEKLGGFDRRFSCCGEDWEMWVRIAAQYPIWYEVEPLAVYRIHSQSISRLSTRTGADMRDLRMAIEIMKSYLPASIADRISHRAKEHWALFSLRHLAPKMLAMGDRQGAFNQIIEALKCSQSLEVIKGASKMSIRLLNPM